MSTEGKPSYLSAKDIDALPEHESVHQYNANAVRLSRTLSDACGLSHIGVHLVRLAPGRDSTQHHMHDHSEEFLYVLEGRGQARIGDRVVEVGAGDFMGFTHGSEPHSLHNPYDSDLVYLMGGERPESDAVHYPDIEKSLFRTAGRRIGANWEDLQDEPAKQG